MQRRQLLIMAHGSRNPAANRSVAKLTEQLQQRQLPYAQVDYCFLELADPDLLRAIEHSVQNRCYQIDVYPLFFSPGNHVLRDVPELLAEAQQKFPDCDIQQLDFFGNNPLLSSSIAQHIDGQITPRFSTKESNRTDRPQPIAMVS